MADTNSTASTASASPVVDREVVRVGPFVGRVDLFEDRPALYPVVVDMSSAARVREAADVAGPGRAFTWLGRPSDEDEDREWREDIAALVAFAPEGGFAPAGPLGRVLVLTEGGDRAPLYLDEVRVESLADARRELEARWPA
jgi:hypothetical protein